MGGSIAIAARFNDGQAICVDGWTNFIPDMVLNATTLSGDDAVVRKTLLEVAAHKNYSGPQPFRAQGYGMVAIDFAAREIHSMQGYTSFGRKSVNQLQDFNGSGWRDGGPDDGVVHPLIPGRAFVNTLKPEAEEMLADGRISKVAVNGVPCEPEILTRDAVVAMLRAETLSFLDQGERLFIDVRIDTAPFVVHDYAEGGSLTAMKERLRTAGFPMTAKDGLNQMFRKAA